VCREDGFRRPFDPALSEKNLKLVRLVLTDGIWSEVISLPDILMGQARCAKDHAPVKAALTAQLAVAVAILSVAPIRLGNLVAIELGENLIKPGGLNSPYWLVFPNYDVKNRVDLNFKFDEALTKLIDEYVHEFRPVLLRHQLLLRPPDHAGDRGVREDRSPTDQIRFWRRVSAYRCDHGFA
jgi:hypothetical protein